jgi:hypothetical protein
MYPNDELPDLEESLTTQQILALGALLQGDTESSAAQKAGCTSRAISKWKKSNEAFKQLLREGKQAIWEQSLTLAIDRVRGAIEYMDWTVNNKAAADRDRLRAAEGIIATAKLCRDMELEERVQQLEQLINGGNEE